MSTTSTLADAEASLKNADTAAALEQLQSQIRDHPGEARLRVFLFQLLAVRGDWKRALEQLTLSAQLDPKALLMAQTYREALRCEALRAQVLVGQKIAAGDRRAGAVVRPAGGVAAARRSRRSGRLERVAVTGV